jgi:hypothetical protein
MIELRYNEDGKLEYRTIKLSTGIDGGLVPFWEIVKGEPGERMVWNEWTVVPSVKEQQISDMEILLSIRNRVDMAGNPYATTPNPFVDKSQKSVEPTVWGIKEYDGGIYRRIWYSESDAASSEVEGVVVPLSVISSEEILKLKNRIIELESQLPKPPRVVSVEEAEEACKILNTMPPKVYSMAKKIFGDYLEQGVDRLVALAEVREIAESLRDSGWEERKDIK